MTCAAAARSAAACAAAAPPEHGAAQEPAAEQALSPSQRGAAAMWCDASAATAAPMRRRYGDGLAPCVFSSRRLSRAQTASHLPPGYSRRATLLLLRMVAAAVAFAAAAGGLAAAALWLLGWRQLLVLAAAAELAFAVHYRHKLVRLSAQPRPHAPAAVAAGGEQWAPLAHFQRMMELSTYWTGTFDARVYLSTWFCGADYRLIRRDNVADLIAYGFWYKSRSEMEAAGLGPLLRQCVSALECAFRISLPPGHQPGLRCMYHLWEPLRTIYRPLAFYAATEALALLTQALLLAMGRSLSRQSTAPAVAGAVAAAGGQQGLGMLVATAGLAAARLRPHAAAAAESHAGAPPEGGEAAAHQQAEEGGPAPVLLLHGIGLGLLPYMGLIRHILAAGLPLVALEYKHVSMRLCSVIPSADDIALAAAALLSRLGVGGACVVAHSYGTFVASRLAQLQPHTLQSLALLDSVCFGMFMPHLLANFIYRQPRTSSLAVWAKDMLFNFVSRDLHCAAALCRRFYWSDVNLWPQDLPGRTLVVLGGRDHLVHVDEVLNTLLHYAARIMFHPGHAHMQMLADSAWMQQVVVELRAMATAGAGGAGAREVECRLTATSATTTTCSSTATAVAMAPTDTVGPAPAAAAAAAASAEARAAEEEAGEVGEQHEQQPADGAGGKPAAGGGVAKADVADQDQDQDAFAPLTPAAQSHSRPLQRGDDGGSGGGSMRRAVSSSLPPLLARPRLLATASAAAAASAALGAAAAAGLPGLSGPSAGRSSCGLHASPGRRGLPSAAAVPLGGIGLGSGSEYVASSIGIRHGVSCSIAAGGCRQRQRQSHGLTAAGGAAQHSRIRRVSSAALAGYLRPAEAAAARGPPAVQHLQQHPEQGHEGAAHPPPVTLQSALSLPLRLPPPCTPPLPLLPAVAGRKGAAGVCATFPVPPAVPRAVPPAVSSVSANTLPSAAPTTAWVEVGAGAGAGAGAGPRHDALQCSRSPTPFAFAQSA
ncbi:hypothetical protein HYH02_000389 [Chlamydomonas schloesseri]|uniref:AB hydrolase-1 domain-containing protein n=1 Tax=Chlamydomonas schloesseri TaxID=2026947 RepID=A0A835WUJ8_9CHLO|nr:hypothetical protein HYH02_000389 [Chlamydomonas schloesseri]|eukprot:KAG2454544.1 hypothetical protein HYH02_000389 [Chlamydomonas schloesseri]